MSFFGRPERSVTARQIADGLDTYQATMDEWLLAPANLDLYEKVCAEIESLRTMSTSALPEATAALADLLLAHTDLTFIVLKRLLVRPDTAVAGAQSGQLAKAGERFRSSLSEMRSLCVRLSTRPIG